MQNWKSSKAQDRKRNSKEDKDKREFWVESGGTTKFSIEREKIYCETSWGTKEAKRKNEYDWNSEFCRCETSKKRKGKEE